MNFGVLNRREQWKMLARDGKKRQQPAKFDDGDNQCFIREQNTTEGTMDVNVSEKEFESTKRRVVRRNEATTAARGSKISERERQ